jgi:hypothetical protein
MKTEVEQQKMKALEESLSTLALQIDGEDAQPGIMAVVVGTPMASIDALFAIRDKEPWRDMTDPSDIARTILVEMGIGE